MSLMVNSADVNDLFSLWHSFCNQRNPVWVTSTQTCMFPSYLSFNYVDLFSACHQHYLSKQTPKISRYGLICLKLTQVDPDMRLKYLLSSVSSIKIFWYSAKHCPINLEMQVLYIYDLILISSPFNSLQVSAPKIIFGSLGIAKILSLGQLAPRRETLHRMHQKSIGQVPVQELSILWGKVFYRSIELLSYRLTSDVRSAVSLFQSSSPCLVFYHPLFSSLFFPCFTFVDCI